MAIPKHLENFQKKRKKQIQDLLKDIEIDKREFNIINLIFISIGAIILLNLRLGLIRVLQNEPQQGINLFYTFILGLLFASYAIDNKEKRFPSIIVGLIISSLSTFTILYAKKDYALPYIINGAVIGMLLIYFIVLAIEYTSILERGRIFSLLMITGAFYFLIILIITYIDALLFISGLIPLLVGIYLYRIRDSEKFKRKPHLIEKEKAKILHKMKI